MEVFLNLSWFAISVALVWFAFRAERAGTLRLSLRLALAGSLLIALLLFPAISMSDDLQMGAIDLEHPRRSLEAGLVPLAELASTATHLMLWMAMPLLMVCVWRQRDALDDVCKKQSSNSSRPDAVRPPPATCFA